MGAGWLLSRKHQVTLYEADTRLGGHTATIDVTVNNRDYAIDTGFIVFNDRTYPLFNRLLAEINVDFQPTEMSFSVSSEVDGLEYAGTNINTLFAQRSNIVSPRFWRLIRDILRFNKESQHDLEQGHVSDNITLGDYLREKRYSSVFRDRYLVPMGAAIWSCGMSTIEHFPLRFFIRFFRNHGLLDITNRPQWHTIIGGSRRYIAPLTRPYADRIKCGDPVSRVLRNDSGVEIVFESGARQHHDAVVFACHSDQALALLDQPTPAEQQILGAIPYQANEVVLHTDEKLLPARRLAWSSWNYRLRADNPDCAVLTYDMNILQHIDSEQTFCVTMNDTDHIAPDRILGRYNYSHPVFTTAGIQAQQRWSEINTGRTWFCGAWWANGFHEDGFASAVRVARELGVDW